MTCDVVYGVAAVAHGEAQIDLLLDLYEPIDSSEAEKPVLITIHGGGFIVEDKSAAEHVDLAMYFAARGFVVASINYRLGRDAPPADPMQVEAALAYRHLFPAADCAAAHAAMVDTKAALRWVHANASSRGLDSSRLFVVGDSAGGFCAVVAGVSECDELDTGFPGDPIPPENHPGADCRVRAIVDLWGGVGPWLEAIDGEDPPMLLVYGTDDFLYDEGLRLRDRCETVGLVYEWVILDGYGHGAWGAEIGGLGHNEAILEFLRRVGALAP